MTEWKPPDEPTYWTGDGATSLYGIVTEDWRCIDCGVNTAPGIKTRTESEAIIKELGSLWEHNLGHIPSHIGMDSEVYMVRESVWKKAGMAGKWAEGCLCIGCLEKRIGRRLKPKDFSDHPFNQIPGSARLLNRRDGQYKGSDFIIEHGPHAFEAIASCDKSLGVFVTAEEAAKALGLL